MVDMSHWNTLVYCYYYYYPTLNCLHSTPNFWEALCRVKVEGRVQKIGVCRNTVYEIDPRKVSSVVNEKVACGKQKMSKA